MSSKFKTREDWTPGFSEVDYVSYKLREAALAATHSNDPARQVGCILALEYKEAVKSYQRFDLTPNMGVGWNTIPDGIELADKATHVVHAEAAAVADYKKHFRKEHDTLAAYVTRMPCRDCAEALVDAYVKTVFFAVSAETKSKWYENFLWSADFFANRNIKLVAIADAGGAFSTVPVRSSNELAQVFEAYKDQPTN